MQLVGELFARRFQIFGSQAFYVINFTSTIAGKGGRGGFGRIVNDFVNADLVLVPIGRRFFGDDIGLCFPFGELIRTVADNIARLRPFVAVLFDDFLWYGIGGVMRGEIQEVGRWIIELHLHGVRIYGFDAKRFDIFFRAAGNGFGIFYRIEDEGIFTACRRIDGAPPGIDEIARSYGRVI